jgi:hypothetical protein
MNGVYPRMQFAVGVGVGLVLLLALSISAVQAQTNAEEENLSHWEWYQEVRPGAEEKEAGPWTDFILTPAVFTRAQADLGDLRLYRADGKVIPYALRVRRGKDEERELPARKFNQARNPDGSAEVSLDLGEGAGEHNEVVVVTGGTNFRRPVRLEGSEDGKMWSVLEEGAYLVHFEVKNQTVDVREISYQPSRYRYLRVRVSPDRSLKEDKPEIRSVSVHRTVQLPGEEVTREASLEPRQPVPGDGGPGSAWLIDLGGRVPVERLELEVTEKEFVRPYRLERADPGEPREYLSAGEFSRRAGEKEKPLRIQLPNEVLARRLRLVVTDHRNPPLTLTAARYTAPVRQVVLATPEESAWPIRLYFGNPEAQAPHYDFEKTLPAQLEPAPTRAELAEGAQANPDYVPPPKPLTERYPWLVYVVLSLASVVLVGLLGLLGREWIRREEARGEERG